jgi:hypothetical protein
MKRRSLAALATIRSRIARRRRASATGVWTAYAGLRVVGRFGTEVSPVQPPRRKDASEPRAGKGPDSPVAHEREVQALSDRSGAPPTEVRALFAAEFARLKIGARVGSYLAVLTESNVRGMLRRKARLAADAVRTTPAVAGDASFAARRAGEAGKRNALRRWEDDGGPVRGHRRAPAPLSRLSLPHG